MICYSNNGFSMRRVSDDYSAETGEVLFSTEPTETELASAFSGYVTAILSVAKTSKQATIFAALAELDAYIPRGLEDTWTVLGVDTTKLPAVQQTRLALKASLRTAYAAVEAATTVSEVESIVIPTEPTV